MIGYFLDNVFLYIYLSWLLLKKIYDSTTTDSSPQVENPDYAPKYHKETR